MGEKYESEFRKYIKKRCVYAVIEAFLDCNVSGEELIKLIAERFEITGEEANEYYNNYIEGKESEKIEDVVELNSWSLGGKVEEIDDEKTERIPKPCTINLKCNLGDIFYAYDIGHPLEIEKCINVGIWINESGTFYHFSRVNVDTDEVTGLITYTVREDEFEKKLFLSRKEAEAAMESYLKTTSIER